MHSSDFGLPNETLYRIEDTSLSFIRQAVVVERMVGRRYRPPVSRPHRKRLPPSQGPVRGALCLTERAAPRAHQGWVDSQLMDESLLLALMR
jgi:hypothetical protein